MKQPQRGRGTCPPNRASVASAGSRSTDDERPSREDKTYGETIFSRPVVPYPRWLVGRKKRQR